MKAILTLTLPNTRGIPNDLLVAIEDAVRVQFPVPYDHWWGVGINVVPEEGDED
jgi:hypothetical protein